MPLEIIYASTSADDITQFVASRGFSRDGIEKELELRNQDPELTSLVNRYNFKLKSQNSSSDGYTPIAGELTNENSVKNKDGNVYIQIRPLDRLNESAKQLGRELESQSRVYIWEEGDQYSFSPEIQKLYDDLLGYLKNPVLADINGNTTEPAKTAEVSPLSGDGSPKKDTPEEELVPVS